MSERQVTHVVVEMVVRCADESGVPLSVLCEGLEVDEHALRRRFGGLDWDDFAQMMERLAARIGTERMLELVSRVPVISPIGQRVLGRFVSTRLLFTFVGRVLGPAMYPMYETAFEETEHPDGSVIAHLTLRLKDGFRGSRLVFDLNGVATAAVPAFIGQPALPLRAETNARGGDFWFTVRAARELRSDPLAPATTPPP